MITFTVPGPAVAKARARVFRTKSGISMAYTPQKTVNYENWIKLCFQEAKSDGFEPLKGPLDLLVIVFEPIPASFSRKNRRLAIRERIFPEKKPDWDNYGKIFSDALNGLAYPDDKHIVNGQVLKRYGSEPRAEVYLKNHLKRPIDPEWD